MASVVFTFDIVCPYAYVASTRIEAVAQRTGASLEWRPVLLGGLYRHTKAAQGAAGSASDTMPAVRFAVRSARNLDPFLVHAQAKAALSAKDLFRNAARFGVPLNYHPQHPVKSLNAQRLLCAAPNKVCEQLLPAIAQSHACV